VVQKSYHSIGLALGSRATGQASSRWAGVGGFLGSSSHLWNKALAPEVQSNRQQSQNKDCGEERSLYKHVAVRLRSHFDILKDSKSRFTVKEPRADTGLLARVP
jgi:hypothetical protein